MAETKSDIAGSILPVSKHQAMLMLESVYLWMDLGKFDHAREVANGAAALMPKTKQVQFALGTIEFNQQKYDKALQAFRAAQRLDPKSALARAHCAEALIFMTKTGEALKELQSARDLEDDGGVPEFAYRLTVFAGIGEVERALKETNDKKRAERFELAIKAYQLASKFEPDRAEPRIRLGEVYVLTGKNAEAKAAVDAGLKLSPSEEEKALADKLLEIAGGKVKEAPKKR
ncbi:MAG: tetratricopeptide repeat protein [Myxococcales bacterium]|nr:tetratricopeptide repeat protein [Myxococcales bacterium]MDP3499270.1 tetratricopeptide repeat protein [Myxococcales bacterium]